MNKLIDKKKKEFNNWVKKQVNQCEYPNVMECEIPNEFMSLPPELINYIIKENNGYWPSPRIQYDIATIDDLLFRQIDLQKSENKQ